MEWSHPHSTGTYVALALGLAGALGLARRFASAPGARSLVLTALRGAALAVLVVILLGPVRVAETRQPGRAPSALFLVDGSRSMGLEAPESRASAVGRIIAEAGRRAAAGGPRVERFRFGDGLSALAPYAAAEPSDDSTRLASALEQLPALFGDAPPAGVFVFSDGRSTERSGLGAIAKGYKALNVPIHVVPVGDPRVSGDVAIEDIAAPRDAPPGSKVPVRVVVRSRGFDGQRAEVRIRPAGDDQGEPLATLPLTLSDDGPRAAELVVEADRARGPLVAEVPMLDHEAIADNNRVPFRVGRRDPKLRVIYLEGSQNGEYHFLRDALVEDPDIECVAIEVDNQFNANPRLYRVDDPSKGYPITREELFTFDVIIVSDIYRGAFTPEQLAWTVELVERRGGGFAMVGGHTSFGSGNWDQTAWDALIPVDMSGAGLNRGPSAYHDGDFRNVVPPGAESHPVWRIVDDPARNRAILAAMPVFHGTNLIDRLKPGAAVLGVSDIPLDGRVSMPLFSAQPFGRGRTFAMATDTTYYWGQEFERYWGEGDNRYYRKFWRNVARWLAENASGGNRRLQAAADKVIYRPGEPIKVEALAFDEHLEPTDAYRLVATLRRPDDGNNNGAAPDLPAPPGWSATLSPRADGGGFDGALAAPAAAEVGADPGSTLRRLELEVTALDGDNVAARASLDVQLLDDPAEFRDPRPDPEALARLARGTGGQVVRDAADLARLLSAHAPPPDRVTLSRSPLWDRPPVWFLLLGVLATEWALRRRKGLA